VNASKHPQERPKWRAGTLATVAMNFADAVSIVVTRPLSAPLLIAPMPHRLVRDPDLRLDSSIPTPLVGVEHNRCPGPDARRDHLQAAFCPRAFANKVADLAALAPLYCEDWRAVRLISSVPRPLVSAPPWEIVGVCVGLAFFPPRSGRVRRPPGPRRSSARWAERLAEAGLHLLANLVHPWPSDPKLPRQARRGLPFGDSSQDQNDRRGCLAGLFEDGPGQDGVISIADFAPVSGPPTIALGHAALTRSASGALQAVGV
jgi:hypothetical protein